MDSQTKQYIGDGVYVDNDGWHIKLICDCMGEPNTIALDGRVFGELIAYSLRCGLADPEEMLRLIKNVLVTKEKK